MSNVMEVTHTVTSLKIAMKLVCKNNTFILPLQILVVQCKRKYQYGWKISLVQSQICTMLTNALSKYSRIQKPVKMFGILVIPSWTNWPLFLTRQMKTKTTCQSLTKIPTQISSRLSTKETLKFGTSGQVWFWYAPLEPYWWLSLLVISFTSSTRET